MGELSVRKATAADIPAITEIYAEAVANGVATFELVAPDEAEMDRRLATLVDGGFPYLVAEALEGGQQRVLGYGYAGPYRARPGYRHTVEDSVYIAADARGRGVGGALLRALIDVCVGLGFRQMVAVITATVPDTSVRLHRAAGFADVGTLKDVGHKHGRWLDTVIMQRPLGPGAETPPSRP